jgi:hypothetical protein
MQKHTKAREPFTVIPQNKCNFTQANSADGSDMGKMKFSMAQLLIGACTFAIAEEGKKVER